MDYNKLVRIVDSEENTIPISKESFSECIGEAVDYLIYCDEDETASYLGELANVLNVWKEQGCEDAFRSFINTGLFHDGVGKVLDASDDSVTYTTTY